MVVTEPLAVDVDRQHIGLVPTPLAKLPQLLSALPSIACRLMLLRGSTPAVAAISGRTSAYWRVETPRSSTPHHALSRGAVVLQGLVGRHLHLTLLLVAQPRPLHFQLPVGERHPPHQRAVPDDIPVGLAEACACQS